MRKNTAKFVEICSQSLPILEPVYEFGALHVSGQEDRADLRQFFMGKEYIGTDMREGPGVDKIIDLHHIKLRSRSVGTALLMDTIEHAEFPRKAIENIYKVLKKNGILIVSSHMYFPIHAHPNDYWRFTPEGLRSLMKPFDTVFIDAYGEPDFPHTVIGFGCKGKLSDESMEAFKKSNAQFKHWRTCLNKKLQQINPQQSSQT